MKVFRKNFNNKDETLSFHMKMLKILSVSNHKKNRAYNYKRIWGRYDWFSPTKNIWQLRTK